MTQTKDVSAKQKQLLAQFAIGVGSFSVGTLLAWTSPTLHQLRHVRRKEYPIHVSDESDSWIVASAALGALCSGPTRVILVDAFGPRCVLLSNSAVAFLGWLLIAMAHAVEMIYIGRFISGFATGLMCVVGTAFVRDICDAESKRSLVNGSQALVALGILYQYSIGGIFSWEWTAFWSGVIVLIFNMFVVFLPESPRYYMLKNYRLDAADAHSTMHGSECRSEDLDEFLHSFERKRRDNNQTTDQQPTRAMLFLEVLRNRQFLAVLGLVLAQLSSAFLVVIAYADDIFVAMDTKNYFISDTSGSINFGMVMTVVSVVAMQLFDVTLHHRRLNVLLCGIAETVSLAALGYYFFAKDTNNENWPSPSWIPSLAITVFSIASSLGTLVMPWYSIAEFIPKHQQDIATTLAFSLYWLFTFFLWKFHIYFMHMSHAITFWCYSGASMLLTICVVPLLRGKDELPPEDVEGTDEDARMLTD